MRDQLVQAYLAAPSRLLLLDYDGVLASITRRPEQAKPDSKVLELLRTLSNEPRNTVVIVSGRDHETLERWLGGLPVDMSAEHGHFMKEAGRWHASRDVNMSWRDDVMHVMRHLVEQYPGSHIEEKHASLVWHYREVDVRFDENDIAARIERAAQGRADIMSGKCVIDVRARGASKGAAAKHWYEPGEWDFVLCIGDDVTDESMFAELPASAWTIKVGDGQTHAKYHLNSQREVVELLEAMTTRG